MKPLLTLILSLSFALTVFGQKESKKPMATNVNDLSRLKKEIVGTWLQGYCGGAEAWVNSFSFDTNGTFNYHPGTPDPNPLASINGYYKIVEDTEAGFVLQLRVISITVNTNYDIDADGNAPSPGLFGYNGWHPKTIPQQDSTFHAHDLSICGTNYGEEGSNIVCPCIQIDRSYRYYKVSDNTEYGK
jgi:hypothetical protein